MSSFQLIKRVMLWLDRLLEYVLKLSKARTVFVATDQNPMINEIKEHFKKKKVQTLSCLIMTFYLPVLY